MLKRKSTNVWDYLAWIVFVGIIIWLILKVTGLINTLIILEYAPFFGAIYLAGWSMHKLEQAVDDIKEIKNEVNNTKQNMSEIEKDVNIIRKNCPALMSK